MINVIRVIHNKFAQKHDRLNRFCISGCFFTINAFDGF